MNDLTLKMSDNLRLTAIHRFRGYGPKGPIFGGIEREEAGISRKKRFLTTFRTCRPAAHLPRLNLVFIPGGNASPHWLNKIAPQKNWV